MTQHICPDCKNVFLQPFRCTTCGAQKLYDATLRRAEQRTERAEADLAAARALLPGVYYMDPPDGGDVDLIEQLRRMAKDAERYRWLRDRHEYNVAAANIVQEVSGEGWDAAIDAALGKDAT